MLVWETNQTLVLRINLNFIQSPIGLPSSFLNNFFGRMNYQKKLIGHKYIVLDSLDLSASSYYQSEFCNSAAFSGLFCIILYDYNFDLLALSKFYQ